VVSGLPSAAASMGHSVRRESPPRNWRYLANGTKIDAKLQNELNSVTPNVISALGGQQTFGTRATRIDLLDEVERGLPVRAYEAVAEALELTPGEEDRLLQVSLRTRARWKKRARLDAATSDRLVRLARILALAVLVLESRAHAVAWLREPSPALGGRSPLAAVASDPGAEKVSNMLYQMEHGVYP
jgi:putative toxin-antitoxin system antitoxin component (TIGR02293 family)